MDHSGIWVWAESSRQWLLLKWITAESVTPFILLLKTQLADAQAEAESSRSYAQKLTRQVRVEGLLEKQEEKLRKLSIEYDEE
ncbi:hypothetical protein Tco_0844825, partial [Tanacetum coccineum]